MDCVRQEKGEGIKNELKHELCDKFRKELEQAAAYSLTTRQLLLWQQQSQKVTLRRKFYNKSFEVPPLFKSLEAPPNPPAVEAPPLAPASGSTLSNQATETQ